MFSTYRGATYVPSTLWRVLQQERGIADGSGGPVCVLWVQALFR